MFLNCGFYKFGICFKQNRTLYLLFIRTNYRAIIYKRILMLFLLHLSSTSTLSFRYSDCHSEGRVDEVSRSIFQKNLAEGTGFSEHHSPNSQKKNHEIGELHTCTRQQKTLPVHMHMKGKKERH